MKNIKVINISKEKKLDKKLYTVKNVPMETVKEICKNKHYLHRVPHIVASYGLYKNDLLLGIITFGIPPSPYLMKICGEEYKSNVLELNKEEGYNLKWINIELLNTEKEPYCEIAKNRIKSVI